MASFSMLDKETWGPTEYGKGSRDLSHFVVSEGPTREHRAAEGLAVLDI